MDTEFWHERTIDEIFQYWKTNKTEGLSPQEVKNRLTMFGYNELTARKKVSIGKILLSQFQDFMVLVLLAATLISSFLGEYADAATILIIVVINAVLGFMQEYRAEKSLQALKKLSALTTWVVRNGISQKIPAREVVPGDIFLIEAGDKIAADGRLWEVQNLEVEESALTGESLPVRKLAHRQYANTSPLGDRKNMVYTGTIAVKGRGRVIACATGMSTEVGQIAGMIQTTEEIPTPLEQRLEHLGRLLVLCCLVICFIVVCTGIIKGEPLLLMCMTGISLAVAAIPEGLPAIVTISLALGVQRMIKRNAIIRKMPAVETLGCTTIICSDKTGTLTKNEMTVRQIFCNQLFEVTGNGFEIKGQFLLNKKDFSPAKDKSLLQTLLISALCNNSTLKNRNVSISGIWRQYSQWSIEGDPTEGALLIAAAKADIWRLELEKRRQRVTEIPFDSDRRRMSVIYRQNEEYILYTKGAPDTMLELCSYYYNGTAEMPLSPETKNLILVKNDDMAYHALRVLAVAYRKLNPDEIRQEYNDTLEKELVFCGLLGMIDPPRPEAKKAIASCQNAGVRTVMITGDHPSTALAIAQELQLFTGESTGRLLTGKEMDSLTDSELEKIMNHIAVYARVSPSHKLRIVRALKQGGHVVAMTGDGVNDAPAIKEAHIGIAMGISGTDVAKEASAMVLADDNFATIVAAVEEGRGIYENIRKFIRYLLSCNLGEVLTMFISSLLGMPLPLLPVQILWVNLVTDGFPAMALGIDPKEPDIMQRPPRDAGENIFSRGLNRKIIYRGLQIGFGTVAIFAFTYFIRGDLALARTMAFSTLVFSQLFHVFDCRSEIHTVFEIGLLKNKSLLMATACSILMQLFVIYSPFLRGIFQTVQLSAYDWLLVISLSGCTFFWNGVKYMLFRPRYKTSMLREIRIKY